MKKLIGIMMIVALVMSLAMPIQAATTGIDIGKDLNKLSKDFVPAVTFESVGLKGRYITADKGTMGLSLKKYSTPETQCYMLLAAEEKPGYYKIAMITDYGNWLYINHPARGKYPNIIPSIFNNGTRTLPNTAYWKLKWGSVKMGLGSETGWTLINAETKWVFATDGRGAFRIRSLNS